MSGRARTQHKKLRHDPLATELTQDNGYLSTKSLRNAGFTNQPVIHPDLDTQNTSDTMDSRMSKKVFSLANEQMNQFKMHPSRMNRGNQQAKFNLDALEEEQFSEDEDAYEQKFEDLTREDELALEMFAPTNVAETRKLADLLSDRILNNERNRNLDDLQEELEKRMPQNFVPVFKDCAQILAHWKSGRMPQAFTIIPNLDNWEEVLQLTKPEDWTANIMFHATKMFSSNLKPLAAQRFYNLVLLPAVRENIRKYKKLNFHLYQAVKRSIFKPKAFYRGIIIPLCQAGCKAKEAVIICGILARSNVPREYTLAALYKLLELPYSGTTHLFIKTILNKKYSLPPTILNALVAHFAKSETDPRRLPVIWQQTFLVFAQRYKKALSQAQKEELKPVMKAQFHRLITPEIRRELFTTYIEEDRYDMMDL